MRQTNRPKYGNTKKVVDGITFDSKREADAYIYLKVLQEKGSISDLQIHPKWELQPKMTEQYIEHLKTKDKVKERTIQQPITYTADFSFIRNGEFVCIDIKISKYLLPKEFVLKKKMMRYVHNIIVTEIYKVSELKQFDE